MIKTINVYKPLPIQVDKQYETKFQTAEMVIVKKIDYNTKGDAIRLWVNYINKPEIGLCPLDVDRVKPILQVTGTMQVCSNCNQPLN